MKGCRLFRPSWIQRVVRVSCFTYCTVFRTQAALKKGGSDIKNKERAVNLPMGYRNCQGGISYSEQNCSIVLWFSFSIESGLLFI